jgi:nucleotide sugar dehydrogenase
MKHAAFPALRAPLAPVRAPARLAPAADPGHATVAILGLGYVGLPTGLALLQAGLGIVGIDASEQRIAAIRRRDVDLLPSDHERLGAALESDRWELTSQASALESADFVLICVPTPVDQQLRPDLRILRRACATVVDHMRDRQTVVLTSTSYVGTTRDLLIRPLEERGFRVGEDVFVAFSPERIDPGNTTHPQETVPRVVGGATARCTEAAQQLFARIAASVHSVSCPEAAELTKLYENTFRAVNIAFAYELAEISRACGLDPTEIIDAAASKPYGFMPFYPGAGVGGHCIPCDPHYLLASLPALQVDAPFVRHGMQAIADRPLQVARRVRQILVEATGAAPGSRVLVVGAAYKKNLQDVRESPAVEIIGELRHGGVAVDYHDPLLPSLALPNGLTLLSVPEPRPDDYDLVVLCTVHDGYDLAWLDECRRVLDCTYRTRVGQQRFLI